MRRPMLCILAFAWGNQAVAAPLRDLPAGPAGQAIQRGHDMMLNTATNPATKNDVGNGLTCSSCHIDAGQSIGPGNFLDTAAKYPSYSAREKAVITLQDRIANCFMRSMNGVRPGLDGPVVADMSAYITWLGQHHPAAPGPASPPSPYPALFRASTPADLAAGQEIYQSHCASCHGANGAGGTAFPPVWGASSYNAGAGLANVPKLAAWIKGNMPLGNAHLTQSQAFQVALYIDSRPRPDFVLSQHLPPGLPASAYNATVREETDTVTSNFKKAGLDLDVFLGRN